ncbi:MAG: ribosome assembly RNA-binding protein YhbY [Gammaproteobacteria bacterium]|nr:ribosome assembly RNA-binding protein YhbY [Gammaproteobacteria bacterium]|tara:strand:- start:1392 stop:1733 length:342 start_codon:yes stop_codon:yes gene_type:complete
MPSTEPPQQQPQEKPNPREAKRMRAIGHKLHPLVIVGDKGASDAVLAELDRALTDHELIKVRVNLPREERVAELQRLKERSGAHIVQATGRVALLLRKARKPKAHLSNLLREF